MHRTKKITVVATAATLLMAAGVSSALADHRPGHAGKVTICHRTGSETNPYVMIRISENALPAHIDDESHRAHPPKNGRVDFIAEGDDCSTGEEPPPPPPPPPPGTNGGGCNASSSSSNTTGNQQGLINIGNVDLGLGSLLGNFGCQSSIGNNAAIAGIGDAAGGVSGLGSGSGGGCNASSSSDNTTGDQTGLINVGNLGVDGGTALANLLCQASLLNNPAIAGIGDAFGGVSGLGSGSGEGCSADSVSVNDTGDQFGIVNLGNLGVNGGTAAANTLCQASLLNNLAIAGIGDAFGGESGLGSGSGEGCFADSVSVNDTDDQFGGINLGNLGVDGGTAAANTLCQASVLDNLALSLVGPAFGGSSLGSELLSGGPLGLLSGAPGYLLSGLTADVRVLANVLVIF